MFSWKHSGPASPEPAHRQRRECSALGGGPARAAADGEARRRLRGQPERAEPPLHGVGLVHCTQDLPPAPTSRNGGVSRGRGRVRPRFQRALRRRVPGGRDDGEAVGPATLAEVRFDGLERALELDLLGSEGSPCGHRESGTARATPNARAARRAGRPRARPSRQPGRGAPRRAGGRLRGAGAPPSRACGPRGG
jgi:hypothetical protein